MNEISLSDPISKEPSLSQNAYVLLGFFFSQAGHHALK